MQHPEGNTETIEIGQICRKGMLRERNKCYRETHRRPVFFAIPETFSGSAGMPKEMFSLGQSVAGGLCQPRLTLMPYRSASTTGRVPLNLKPFGICLRTRIKRTPIL